MLSYSFTIALFFCAEDSRCDSAGVSIKIWRKVGDDAHFTFETDALLGVGRLGEVKHDAFNSLFKGGKIAVLVGA